MVHVIYLGLLILGLYLIDVDVLDNPAYVIIWYVIVTFIYGRVVRFLENDQTNME